MDPSNSAAPDAEVKSCPVVRCPVTHGVPSGLAAHLHMEHGWPAARALEKARKHFGTGGDVTTGSDSKGEIVEDIPDIPVHRCPKCDAVVHCEWSAIAAIEEQARRLKIVAGLMRARLLGKTLGRPRVSPDFDETRARDLLSSGLSIRATARVLGVYHQAVARALKK